MMINQYQQLDFWMPDFWTKLLAAFISKAGNHLAVTAVVAQQGRNLSLQSVTVDLNHLQ